MGKKPLTVVAFEIGTDRLKLVEMTRADGRVIAAGVFPLAPGRARDRDHLTAQVRSALDVTVRGLPRALIASVPLGEAFLRVIDVPDGASEAEAREHAAWDMGVYLGRPADEFALDVVPGPVDSEGSGSAVTAAAFPRAEAVALRAILESVSGLALVALDVDAAALVNLCATGYPEFAAERVLIVQANVEATALLRVHAGVFHGAAVRRDAGDALREGVEAQERAEGLLRVARGIAASMRAADEGWDAPDHLLLCGDLAVDADFRELLRTHLPRTATVFNPFRNIPGPDPLECPEAYPGAPLAAAIGLAARLVEDAR